jgi:hypothetical protein
MSMQDIAGIKGNKQKETEAETPQSLQVRQEFYSLKNQ